ncbi:Crp/Fnr family transcriptional regulator [Neoroseomonas soli]|uniref:Crp/Fnr family transcriptional regulator n=1 Tax=Neoroseomonas soli TaxID=1081025 RepID=A0A9X9WRC6_9PROT|nr:Crp/Fnr family transcriptional regulator [Neoroseomonas soli]MBR0669705.1 Crp/Fnr family transcriptional regulator [Neoroseomonas soli]
MRSPEALLALETARRRPIALPAGTAVYRQGEPVQDALNLISGWVMLAQTLPDGRRQILRFLLPGALFGLMPTGQATHSHSAEALTPALVCPLPLEALHRLRHAWPGFDDRILWTIERDAALIAERLTTVGQRDALARVAHLLLELVARAQRRFPPEPGRAVPVPLTNRLIGDATGLTPEHVSRMLRTLREQGIVTLLHRRVVVQDAARLVALADPPKGLLGLWSDPAP